MLSTDSHRFTQIDGRAAEGSAGVEREETAITDCTDFTDKTREEDVPGSGEEASSPGFAPSGLNPSPLLFLICICGICDHGSRLAAPFCVPFRVCRGYSRRLLASTPLPFLSSSVQSVESVIMALGLQLLSVFPFASFSRVSRGTIRCSVFGHRKPRSSPSLLATLASLRLRSGQALAVQPSPLCSLSRFFAHFAVTLGVFWPQPRSYSFLHLCNLWNL